MEWLRSSCKKPYFEILNRKYSDHVLIVGCHPSNQSLILTSAACPHNAHHASPTSTVHQPIHFPRQSSSSNPLDAKKNHYSLHNFQFHIESIEKNDDGLYFVQLQFMHGWARACVKSMSKSTGSQVNNKHHRRSPRLLICCHYRLYSSASHSPDSRTDLFYLYIIHLWIKYYCILRTVVMGAIVSVHEQHQQSKTHWKKAEVLFVLCRIDSLRISRSCLQVHEYARVGWGIGCE